MKRSFTLCLVVVALVALVAAPGCKPKTVEDLPSQPVEEAPVASTTPPPAPPVEVRDDDFQPSSDPIEQPSLSIRELNDAGVLQTVYFDYDRSELTGMSETVLRKNADWLMNNRNYSVAIEGHCDERGTIEYNLALGQRRANAVRDFLSSAGVGLTRMRTVSYGEERPAAQGSGESAWSRNRRAEFVIEE